MRLGLAMCQALGTLDLVVAKPTVIELDSKPSPGKVVPDPVAIELGSVRSPKRVRLGNMPRP